MTSSSIEQEYNEINKRNGWHSLFQEIRDKCEKEAEEKSFSVSESGKNQNRSLNRYRDVNPYDHSRIIIHRGKTDYINANLVKMERADRKYILTQGPLRETIGHFWLMIWEQNTKAILMLNKLLEKKQIKCHMYWPEKIGEQHILHLNDVGLTVEYLRCEEYTNFSKRTFKLTDTESKKYREVIQFHYTTWPDFGIPSSPVAFLQFLKQVRDSGALDPEVGPAVVHCSAGIGRSGTFCLVDSCLVLIDKEGENKVSIREILYELRRYRMGLIQTADQLYFSYQAIIEGIKLLKDPKFIDYEEIPRIPKEEEDDEQYIIDETPPPLPPRTHSLQPSATTNVNKPLPPIPNSESVHEDLISNMNDTNYSNKMHNNDNNVNTTTTTAAVAAITKTTLSNDINSSNTETKIKTSSKEFIENPNLNRPLPPIPRQNSSLEKVNESDSEYDDNDNDDDESEHNLDDNEINYSNCVYNDDNDDDDDDEDMNDKLQHTNDNNADIDNRNIDNRKTIRVKRKNITSQNAFNELSDQSKTLQNGGDTINNPGNENPELKRRKRVERQADIERKVNEIKRKQREAEESEKSSKKRRSLITFIAAGVIVGVICVYVYSKF